MNKISPGELHVWHKLADLNPKNVCKQAKVTFDAEIASYTLRSFGCDLGIAINDRKIIEYPDANGPSLLGKLGRELCLSALWYMITAKNIPETNRLVKPASLPGGQIFVKGSHVLPLEEAAVKYDGNPQNFIETGVMYGGEKLSYGDASIKLYPYPRVPVVLILWKGDDEFPPNVDILLDASCDLQLPLDIIWSTCLMSVLVML
jgi:hypothetical protein